MDNKSKYKFDPKTGTMVPVSAAVEQAVKARVEKAVVEEKATEVTQKPEFEKDGDLAQSQESLQRGPVKMRRVKRPTSLILASEDGKPESYLDSESGVVMFRERADYDICQITDERSGKALAYIGGYALQINFNLAELNTLDKIEQCLQGLVKLFRHKIMSQTIGYRKEDGEG